VARVRWSPFALAAQLPRRLGAKFTALFLLMALFVAATGWFGINRMTQVADRIQGMMRTRAAQEKMAVLMKATVQEARVHLLEAAAAYKDADDFDYARDDYEAARGRFRGYGDLLLKGNAKIGIEAAARGSKLEQKVNDVLASWSAFEAAAAKAIERKTLLVEQSKQDATGAAARAALADAALTGLIQKDVLAATGKVETAIDELLVTVGSLMNETRDEVAGIARRARLALLSVIALAIALALIMGIGATSRMVIRPIMEMKAAAERIAAGDLAFSLPIRGRDEIASLGEGINAMSRNLKEMFLKIREVTDSLSQSASSIVSSSERVMEAAGVQKDAIETTAGAVVDLGASTAAVAGSAHRLSDSAADSSAVITQTKHAINSVAESAESFDSSAQETASSIQEMVANIRQISLGIEHLSSSSEQIASSITEVSASTRSIEEHARESVGLADAVLAEASQKGTASARAALDGIVQVRESVGRLADVVQALGKRSQDIGSILTVIDEVASQTNLLALNAAILSAQAGEHGKGFAVVSAKIKALADRTAASVRDIGGLITSVQDETRASVRMAADGIAAVDRGLDLVREVEQALGGIARSSVASSEKAQAIQRSTEEEARAVKQIADAIREMSEQVERISRALQEQGKGSAYIIEHTEKMRAASRRVRGAIGEQREGSTHMVATVENVARQAGSIAEATAVQKERGSEIGASMTRIKDTTRNLVVSANEMKATVASLTLAAQHLQDELHRFTV
jgi:methyl-accepting chemotaxis protein